MRAAIAILCVLSLLQGHSQEVRLGLTMGTTPLKRVAWDTAQYSPANGYHTYIEEDFGSGLIDDWKAFNAVNLGAVINISYRKWSFNIEPQYFFERSVYRFKKPIEMKRVVGAKGFRMPFYFTYKFFKKENSSYILFGMNVTKTNHWDFHHPTEGFYFSGEPKFQGGLNVGNDHFQGILYDNKSYGSFIIGLGKQFKKLNSSLRIQFPTRGANARLPIQTWRLEWTFSWFFLSTKDFTKKHPLFIED